MDNICIQLHKFTGPRYTSKEFIQLHKRIRKNLSTLNYITKTNCRKVRSTQRRKFAKNHTFNMNPLNLNLNTYTFLCKVRTKDSFSDQWLEFWQDKVCDLELNTDSRDIKIRPAGRLYQELIVHTDTSFYLLFDQSVQNEITLTNGDQAWYKFILEKQEQQSDEAFNQKCLDFQGYLDSVLTGRSSSASSTTVSSLGDSSTNTTSSDNSATESDGSEQGVENLNGHVLV